MSTIYPSKIIDLNVDGEVELCIDEPYLITKFI